MPSLKCVHGVINQVKKNDGAKIIFSSCLYYFQFVKSDKFLESFKRIQLFQNSEKITSNFAIGSTGRLISLRFVRGGPFD